MNEFELISHFFQQQAPHDPSVTLGIGDDAAVITPPRGKQLVISVDTLVAGVHFFEDVCPETLGHKVLAVNLSDLAAMAATPAYATLAITLPQANPEWLTAFCKGFFKLAKQYHVQLIGGDTTRGPLSITCQIHGYCPRDHYLSRTGAKAGDLICVTGDLGRASLALEYYQNNQTPPEVLQQKLLTPIPRIECGQQLQPFATAAIDISDGLCADLQHLLQANQLGATLDVDALPLSPELLTLCVPEKARHLALTQGDEYELLLTLPPDSLAQIKTLPLPCPLTPIGILEPTPGLRLRDKNQNELPTPPEEGYLHF